jgi:hypothetical protein
MGEPCISAAFRRAMWDTIHDIYKHTAVLKKEDEFVKIQKIWGD